MPRKRWLSLWVASLLAVTANSLFAQDPTLYLPAEAEAVFTAGAEYLIMTRDADINTPDPFLGGPDSSRVNFGDVNFDYQSGIRAFAALSNQGIRVEGIYTNFGTFNYSASGSLTQGLAFDEGITGDWTGANFINLTTGFEGLHAAATAAMGGDADEFEGLSPSLTFADPVPTYEVFYKSFLETWEINIVTEDPAAFVQFGAGYSNIQLNENAGVNLRGTLRAVDNALPNNGISHNSLITFGNLNFLGGTPDGFEDELGNASGLPDSLQMSHSSRTSNDLNGIQFILQDQIMYWRGWTIDGTVKAGVYHNHMEGSVTEMYVGTDPGPGGDSSAYGRTFYDSKTALAFAGSAGLQSNFPLSDHWSLLSGYEMLLIHGVALAPEQYGNVQGPTFVGRTYNVDTHGQIIAHGANVGLQFSY